MLKETMVVLATEFDRSSKINDRDGRDHQTQAFSCVVAGGGIAAGGVYGATEAVMGLFG